MLVGNNDSLLRSAKSEPGNMAPATRHSQNLGHVVEYIPGRTASFWAIALFSLLALTMILDSQTDYISAPTFAPRIQTRRCPAPNRPGNERLDMPTALLRRLWSPTRTRPATSPSMTLFCTTRSTTTLALCTLATCTGLLSSSTIFWAPRRTGIDPLCSTVLLTREVSLCRLQSIMA